MLKQYQKLEEIRLEKIKASLSSYFAFESAFIKAKGEKLAAREEAVKGISKETEIKRIITEHEKKEKPVDEIQYKKIQCKFQNVYEAYVDTISRGSEPVIFDVEAALKTTLDSLELNEDMAHVMGLLTNCWDGKHLSPQEKEEFKEKVKTPIGRKMFGVCLNKYRKNGMFSMKDEGYGCVAELLYLTMNYIQEQEDIENAMVMMIYSQTYYLDKKTEGKVERMSLQLGIQTHPYWKNKSVWDKAIAGEIEKELKQNEAPDESESDKQARTEGTVYAKLGTFSNNMLQFETPKADVEQTIFTYATKYKLPPPYVNSLKVPI